MSTDRFKWPTPPADYVHRHLSEDEQNTIEYRVQRYLFLWEEFGPPADMLLVGGIPAMFALDELKRSYAYGNFMATVLLAQLFVEQSLAGGYSLARRDNIAESGFASLIETSLKDGHIPPHLADTLHSLRKIRNPYTHHRAGTGKGSYMGRIATAFTAPEDLVVEDAKVAIRAVVDFLRHNAPDWNPEKVQWSHTDDDDH